LTIRPQLGNVVRHRDCEILSGVAEEPQERRSGRKPVDAEMSLGAAGKSACATKVN